MTRVERFNIKTQKMSNSHIAAHASNPITVRCFVQNFLSCEREVGL
jgi:hypothetical protein